MDDAAATWRSTRTGIARTTVCGSAESSTVFCHAAGGRY